VPALPAKTLFASPSGFSDLSSSPAFRYRQHAHSAALAVTPSRSVTSLVLLGFPSLIRLRRLSLVAKGRLTQHPPNLERHISVNAIQPRGGHVAFGCGLLHKDGVGPYLSPAFNPYLASPALHAELLLGFDRRSTEYAVPFRSRRCGDRLHRDRWSPDSSPPE